MKEQEKVSKMAENKLPSGVGRKIVEALKKQAEIEIQPIPDTTSNLIQEPVQEETLDNVITDNIELGDEFADFSLEDDASEQTVDFVEESFENNNSTSAFEDAFPQDIVQNINFDDARSTMFEEKEIFNHTQTPIMNQMGQQNYSVPANVAVLKRLIMQLPQGVTKQTGAQIIRQTMEALGISMNSVLKEAQQGQDSLTSNAKACLSQIAEYKNNIKSLEKQVQDYKKQAVALNDLISLFVMTDRH